MEKQERIASLPDCFLDDDQKTIKTLAILTTKGYTAELVNYDNHHVQVKSQKGKLYNYYPTTGTIMGEPDANGLDDLLWLLERW